MKDIGAALGDQGDLPAGGAALIGIVAHGCHAKLFDGVQSGAHGPLKGGAANLIVIVDAVERNVGLVTAAAVQGAVSRVNVGVDVVADEGDTRLQAEHASG